MKKYFIIPFLALIVPSIAFASFNSNLYYGMTGNADVTQLQTILTSQDLYSGPITGNFFGLTQAAVEAFQSAHSISPTGYVGTITRAALNNLGASGGNTVSASSGFISPTIAQLNVKTQVLVGTYLTVDSPADYTSNNSDQYYQPDTGDKFVSVYVSFDNESQNSFDYNPYNFTIVDPSGDSYNMSTSLENRSPALNYGTLNPSNLASGYVLFEVPATISASQLTVHYESYGYPQAVVDFKPSAVSQSTSSGNTTSASTATTCSTGYGYSCSPTTTSQPTTAVQSSAVITPSTLTDQEYAQQITENVLPFYTTATTDLVSAGSLLSAIGNTEALADLNQAQSQIDLAVNGMQPLQTEIPSNMTTINTLMNEGLSSYSEGIGLAITALNGKNLSEMLTADTEINQGTLDMNQMVSDMTQLEAQLGIQQ